MSRYLDKIEQEDKEKRKLEREEYQQKLGARIYNKYRKIFKYQREEDVKFFAEFMEQKANEYDAFLENKLGAKLKIEEAENENQSDSISDIFSGQDFKS